MFQLHLGNPSTRKLSHSLTIQVCGRREGTSFPSVKDFNMFDPRGNDALPTRSRFNQNNKDLLITDPRPAEHDHAMNGKTVKELLLMRRRKWSRSQDDNTFKPAKSQAFARDLNPHLLGPSGPVTPDTTRHFLPASPANGHMTPRQTQQASLLHWQVQRETQRVAGISAEMLHEQDADGDTFLHIAVAQGRRALVYALAAKMTECGSLDIKEHNGQTALQLAAATDQQLIVSDLLALGAEVNVQDLWGRSPLHTCAEKGHFLSLQSMRRALTQSWKPIDMEMFNYDGLTPLHTAVLSHNAVVKELRSLGNPSAHMGKELMQRGQTYVECVKTLLLMGASCGTKDPKSGRTSLHMASEAANVELLNILLDQPSSPSLVNVATFSGNTALHIVSSLQNHDTQVRAVKLLMRKGADPGTRNFEKELPCQLVPEGAIGEQVRLILKGKYSHA